MNWKVGDKFWVDYEKCKGSGASISEWKKWFPPNEAPFTIAYMDRDSVTTHRRYNINISRIYHNKNHIVQEIIKDLL